MDIIISAAISLVGVVVSALSALSLVNWRLNKIEEQLQKHNSYAEKFNDIAVDIAAIKKDIEYMKE